MQCMSQVLLAIAAGAWLLMPDWIAASAAAGIWLDEHEFKSEVCHGRPSAPERCLITQHSRG